MQNVLAEFVGVALFAFFGGACDANSVSSGERPLPSTSYSAQRQQCFATAVVEQSGLPTAALGNGLCLAVLIYATAGISGGHLNPAVTTAMYFTKRIGSRRLWVYIAAQLLGAVVGALSALSPRVPC
eukprot:758160-Rhodomonas_salina.1